MGLFTGNRRELSLLLAVTFLLAAGVIWVRTATVKDTYLYVQNEREFRKLQQEIQAARVKWLKLTSPKRLETMARALGLGSPKIEHVLKYEPEKTNTSAFP